MEKRVFVSATANKTLDERRRKLKAAVLDKIREAGYAPQEFFESGIPENWSWSFENLDRVMRKCVGAVVFGFPRWTVPDSRETRRLIRQAGQSRRLLQLDVIERQADQSRQRLPQDGLCPAAKLIFD